MGSSKADVEVSYDVSNEFFRLWLDERMNYTCAVYETPEQPLEAAQLNKLRVLADFDDDTGERVPERESLRGEVAGVAAAVRRCGVGVGRPEVAMVLRGGVTVEVSLSVGVTAPPV